MTYYAFIQDDKINGKGQCPCIGGNLFSLEIDELVYNDLDHYMVVKNEEEIEVPEYEAQEVPLLDENNEPVLDENNEPIMTTEEVQIGSHTEIQTTYEIVLNPNWEEEEAQRERQRLDALTLTPADVERALYRAKGMDFEDLKALIAQQIPSIDIKGLAIEFRAKDFYRGAEANGMRLFDVVGQLLGYTPQDMDYLFEHKELPNEL